MSSKTNNTLQTATAAYPSKGTTLHKTDINKREHYDSISTETRRMLVKLTHEEGYSIRKASTALKIKYSTGKTLIQLFRKTGRIDRVKQQRARTGEGRTQVRKIIQKVLSPGEGEHY